MNKTFPKVVEKKFLLIVKDKLLRKRGNPVYALLEQWDFRLHSPNGTEGALDLVAPTVLTGELLEVTRGKKKKQPL